MSDRQHNHTQQAPPMEYFIAVLLGIITGLGSLGVAVGLTSSALGLGPITAAAGAWAIGMATAMWWLPWVKQAVRPVGGDSDV